VLLLFVLAGSIFTPAGNNWLDAFNSLFHGNGWQLDSSSMINHLWNSEIKNQIANASASEVGKLKEKLYLINGARILLVTVFTGILVLVYLAGKRKTKHMFQK
jgi:hypothetical protein